MARQKLLVLEFNELCPTLLDRWMAEGHLPNFKRLHDASEVFVTVADAEPPALEPWIQWYSMHTGLSYDQHGVFRLTDGPKAGHPDIWGVLRDAGLRTANVCSMNAKGFAVPGNLFVPDPWCTSESAYPAELNTFHGFVSSMVQEYSNRDNALDFGVVSNFLWYLATHGLRPGTIRDILSVLFDEKVRDPSLNWRRAVVLDWMQRDVFLHYFRRYQPDFTTFFLNSTAHLQHTYWRHMDPDAFEVQPTPEDVRKYGNAILFGYRNMDRVVGEFLALERRGVTLAFTTALSQQPFLKCEGIGGQHFYRPKDADALLRTLTIDASTVQPTMTHQYMLRFDTEEKAAAAEVILDSVRCDGRRAIDFERRDDGALYFGCMVRSVVSDDATLEWVVGNHADTMRFLDAFYMIDEIKSGMHHPDGCFWLKTGNHVVHKRRVSVLDVFPTVLDFFAVDYQPSDAHPFGGRSLLSDKARDAVLVA